MMLGMTRLTQFRNGSCTFDVIDSGPLDGTPVVLLHGFPQRASAWSAVAERLHERGLRTYAPDQRGYSPDARPRTRFSYRGSTLVSDIEALIDAIGPGPVHLVGHDWGAYVAWCLAGTHPDKVSTLTAISVPHPGAYVRSMLTGSQAVKSLYTLFFNVPYIPELLLRRRGGFTDRGFRRAGMTREMVERFHDEMVDDGALSGGLGWYRAMFLPGPSDFSRTVPVPTTYIWSDGDVALSRKGAEINERWVTGPYELEIYEGASHWLLEERPAELAESIAKRIGV
jgi:pimeloyl-ACP methyl ester carboxylesterase